MNTLLSRRDFTRTTGLTLFSLIASRKSHSFQAQAKRVHIHAAVETGTIRPELHGHFAEHLGSCTYGGLWVGRNSTIPNIDGYRKQAIEYLKALGMPVLRWPGGCFADDYHWRDGIGSPGSRPKTVNIHWGNYVEDNSFGTHEFIGLCRLIGAQSVPGRQRRQRFSRGTARLGRVLQLPVGQHAVRRAGQERVT